MNHITSTTQKLGYDRTQQLQGFETYSKVHVDF
jgi:hypothetical protein